MMIAEKQPENTRVWYRRDVYHPVEVEYLGTDDIDTWSAYIRIEGKIKKVKMAYLRIEQKNILNFQIRKHIVESRHE